MIIRYLLTPYLEVVYEKPRLSIVASSCLYHWQCFASGCYYLLRTYAAQTGSIRIQSQLPYLATT